MNLKRACVIGFPISHSRSPLIHNYWIKQLGLSGTYEKIAVEPANAKSFIRELPQSPYVGCNVTIPHKEVACSAVTHLSPKASRINSVNTVYVRNGETFGTSTDGEGYVENLLSTVPDFDIAQSRVVVLGAGGSASAIIGELLDRGCKHISIFNRTRSRSETLVHRFGPDVTSASMEQMPELFASCTLLVNTTPLGMNTNTGPDVPLEHLQVSAIVSDIVYTPLKTELIMRAEAQGLRTVTGLGMLLHQAVAGFELWFGVKPKVTQELYDLVARDVEASL